MTEQQLRQKVVSIMNAWVGGVRNGSQHQEILKVYNSYKPLARGYAVQPSDAYCATTTSAVYIKAGVAQYIGTECSVPRYVDIAKSKGIWVENDAYVPKIGDAVVYDWEDSGSGDNTGSPDHIGIVVAVSGSSFTVGEGNMSGGKIGTRSMQVNGRYIRGFIAPDFAAIAKALDGDDADEEDTQTMKTIEEIAYEVIAGKWGNGNERKELLTAAGYDYSAVQSKVNEILSGGSSSPSQPSNPEPTPAPSTGASFTDVSDDAWYADDVNWASLHGILNGYGDGKFGPDDNVTRAQLSAALHRFADLLNS